MDEARLRNIEKRLERLEHSTTLDPHGQTLSENIHVWFRSHHFLVVTQFLYELEALGLVYSKGAVRNALANEWKKGRLERLERGIYIAALAR